MNLSTRFPAKIEDVADYLGRTVRAASADPFECRVCWEFLRDPDIAAKLVRLAVDPCQVTLVCALLRDAVSFLEDSTNEGRFNTALARLKWSTSGLGGGLPKPITG